jgi:hypothetical protein
MPGRVHLSIRAVSSDDGVWQAAVMVVRMLAFVIVQRILDLDGLVKGATLG